MLSRSFLPEDKKSSMLAYSPMFHARLFVESQKYRDSHLEPTRDPLPAQPAPTDSDGPAAEAKPFLDGNPAIDRPLFVQFCANDPKHLLDAATIAAPYCDAVDLNLGCPQGIARKGHYGAFLQEDQELVYNMIHTLHENLSIPVTAKIRVLDTKEATLAYAQNVLRAGASILTVHGRRREQKGHITGVADWEMIRFLRDNLPPETVLFANGNVLQHGDLERSLAATGADGVMSAEGNLSDPALFATPPEPGREGREYWRGRDGRGGWRADAVMRRYLDILHRYVFDQAPPPRRPLFVPGDDTAWLAAAADAATEEAGPPRKKQKKDGKPSQSPNMVAVQPHLFHLLRHLVSRHHDVRNMLAKSRSGAVDNYERILDLVERKVAEGLLEYERTDGRSVDDADPPTAAPAAAAQDKEAAAEAEDDDPESSAKTVRECKRPWWIVQPIVRPLPKEALAKGAITLKKAKRADGDAGAAAPANAKTEAQGGSSSSQEATPPSNDGVLTPATAALDKKTSFQESELVSG